MKKLFKEFGAFIKRGNVLDLAVALIIGGAFNTIVEATLSNEGAVVSPEVAIFYGAFLQAIIDFLIIAATIFIILKVAKGLRERAEKRVEELKSKLIHKEEETVIVEEKVEEPVVIKPTTEEILLEIRDLLKDQNTK